MNSMEKIIFVQEKKKQKKNFFLPHDQVQPIQIVLRIKTAAANAAKHLEILKYENKLRNLQNN